MNRIRAWVIRLLQGEAKSTPPGEGQLRESHPDWASCSKHDWHLRDECVECAYEVEGQ